MLYLLAQDSPPQDLSLIDVLWLPVLLTVVGVAVFYFGLWIERKKVNAPWKWGSLIFIIAGLVIGYPYAAKYGDPFYRSQIVAMGEKKMMVSHYGAVLIPALGLAAIILLHFFNHRIKIAAED